MTHSNANRLTPGVATAVVLYIVACLMAVAVAVLTITGINGAVIVSSGFQFGLVITALFLTWGLSTSAAASVDGCFTWPLDGPVDPAPYQRLPNLDWRRASQAMMLNHYFSSVAFAVFGLGLFIAAANSAWLFAPAFHFVAFTVSVVASAGFLIGGAVVQNRKVSGTYAVAATLWIASAVLTVLALVFGIVYACGGSFFGPEFDLSVAFGAFAGGAYSYYRAAREYDRARPKWRRANKTTSVHLFIIAAVIAVVGIVVALAGIGVSLAIHVAMVAALLISAFVVAVIAGLLCDRKASY